MAKKFRVVYILPSRYDDEGYVHRYMWGVLPSNTLFCLRGLTLDVAKRGGLGEGVEVRVDVYDDSVHKISPSKIVREARADGAKLLVGFVGVQSNQFPRAGDLACQFREHDVPVILGGFHVSGVLAMFHEPDRDMERLMAHGVTMVAGEVDGDGVLAEILRDAWEDKLQPLYRVTESPSIMHSAVPAPDPGYLKRFVGKMGTIDTSRGCPFNCSFCTIINVQGRKMRHRSAECMLQSIEEHYQMGIIYYFFTDDNFSRSPVWSELFDGLTKLREEGKDVQFMMQVDTQAWRIPGFIERASKAGCFLTFIGMETINEENLKAASKRQNKVHQYAEMVEAWHAANILVHVGYIIGFPGDTVESVRGNLATLKDEIKVDEASFFMLTPLPGSRDHFEMVKAGTPIDADLNSLDSFHETFRHAKMAPGDWQGVYHEAWESFYGKEHITNVLLRTPADRYWRMFWLAMWNRYATLNRTHTMITGFLRRKERLARRPSFPTESRARYAWRRAKDYGKELRVCFQIYLEYQEIWLLTRQKNDLGAKTLSELRGTWAELRQRVDAALTGSDDETAKARVISMLGMMGERIAAVAQSGARLPVRVVSRLTKMAEEVAFYREEFETRDADRENIDEGRIFIRQILDAYEELTIKNVARRRRCNAVREDLAEALRPGHHVRISTLTRLPKMAYDEVALGLRFAIAFFHATSNRLRVA